MQAPRQQRTGPATAFESTTVLSHRCRPWQPRRTSKSCELFRGYGGARSYQRRSYRGNHTPEIGTSRALSMAWHANGCGWRRRNHPNQMSGGQQQRDDGGCAAMRCGRRSPRSGHRCRPLHRVASSAVMLAFGFATTVGVFFGFYPARKAARLNPIDALRHE